MMRILFLFFLLVNAAYFYMYFSDANEPVSSTILKQPPLPPGVEKLTLLRERGLGVKPSVLPAKEAPKPENVPAATSVIKPATEPSNKTVAAPQALVSEPPRKSNEPACFTLGPFVKADAASRNSMALSTLGVRVEERAASRRTPKGYWVYLAPSTSYQAAKRKVTELQKKGLSDLFIMGKGSRQNAISLGLFNQENAAEDRFQHVKKLGLNPIIETQYRVSEQIWLDMTVPGGETGTVAAIIEIADGLQQAELSQRKCQ